MNTLHYVYDPLCGWCYAAEPMVELARRRLGGTIRFELHAGGLFSGGTLPEAKRQYIRGADKRIAELTGQPFGKRYLDGLLSDPATHYDSSVPAAAILAAQELKSDNGLLMLRAVQHAHYQEGRRVVEPAVLTDIAESMGLKRESFGAALAAKLGEPTQHHISATRQLMQQVNVTGFPSFFLQRNGSRINIDHQRHYQSPEGFVAAVLQAEQ